MFVSSLLFHHTQMFLLELTIFWETRAKTGRLERDVHRQPEQSFSNIKCFITFTNRVLCANFTALGPLSIWEKTFQDFGGLLHLLLLRLKEIWLLAMWDSVFFLLLSRALRQANMQKQLSEVAAGSISSLLVKVQCTKAKRDDRNVATTVELPVREQVKAELSGSLTQAEWTDASWVCQASTVHCKGQQSSFCWEKSPRGLFRGRKTCMTSQFLFYHEWNGPKYEKSNYQANSGDSTCVQK